MRKLWSTFNLPTKISVVWVALVFFFVLTGSFLPLPDPTEFDPDASGVGLFSSGHLLGTDINGYDLLSNVINGARISILIALISVGVGGLIGSAIGIGSAYVRGKVDLVVNLFFNILLSIPNLVLGLALVAILATSVDPSIPIDPNRRVIIIIFSLTVVIIPILGRIARGATLSWVNREFIVAARSMGMKDRHIIFKHIVPNVLPAIYAVIVSWGAMIGRVAGDFTYAPQSMYVPVIVLALTVIAFNQIGDHLRSQLDSREGKI